MNKASPKYVYDREGKEKGEIRGSGGPCAMESCGGDKIYVRWADGRVTKPCAKGMHIRKDGQYQIA